MGSFTVQNSTIPTALLLLLLSPGPSFSIHSSCCRHRRRLNVTRFVFFFAFQTEHGAIHERHPIAAGQIQVTRRRSGENGGGVVQARVERVPDRQGSGLQTGAGLFGTDIVQFTRSPHPAPLPRAIAVPGAK